jgi:hypothetical protein
MSMNMGYTIMYLHFTVGDNLWFLDRAPSIAGVMAGAYIRLLIF